MTTHRRTTSLLLLSWFLLLSAAGEGLHLVPGCGHFVRLPGGRIVGVGVERTVTATASHGAQGGLTDEKPARLKVLGSGDCLLCGFVAQVKQSSGTAHFDVAVAATRMPSVPCAPTTLVFQRLMLARAPPIA